jgi:hypothetical protein
MKLLFNKRQATSSTPKTLIAAFNQRADTIIIESQRFLTSWIRDLEKQKVARLKKSLPFMEYESPKGSKRPTT